MPEGPVDDVSKIRRAAAAAALVARHPKRAYRALYHAASAPAAAPAEAPSADDAFERAMLLLLGTDVGLTFERDGVTWTVPPGHDGIAEELFHSGEYSGGTLAAIAAYLAAERPAHGWIVDVGANIGTSTIPFARSGFHVLAIEPVPAALRFLHTNIDANGLRERVRVIEGAIATGVDDVLIAVSTSLGNSEVIGSPSDTPGFDDKYGRATEVRVPAFRLDATLAAAGVDPSSVAIVWADTQGSETAVIETGADLWAAGVPLFAEFWLHGLELQGGLDRFFEAASAHFTGFIDASRHGFRIVDALDSPDRTRGAARAMGELPAFASEVASYPGRYSDVLLLP